MPDLWEDAFLYLEAIFRSAVLIFKVGFSELAGFIGFSGQGKMG